MRIHNFSGSLRERGSTLLVAVVILLLASLMALMAMSVGVFEQRSSGNDLRAKIVHQVAEAGLAQGFEYLMRANPQWLDDDALWESCVGVNEFPCTAVPPAQKDNMFRLKATGYTVDGLNAKLTSHMLQLPAALTGAGLQDVAYGVAPVLCRVLNPVSGTTINCSAGSANLSDRRVVTFVSVAQLRGDSGRTTLTQTVAKSSLLAQGAGVPALIATGNVHPSGNGDVVAMGDAAGDGEGSGLNISVWTRLDVDTKSAFGTCDRRTFLQSSPGVSLNDPDWREKSVDGGCPKKGDEGWDVLDVDVGTQVGTNMNVVPKEFPCDLFEYAFGVKAWENKSGDADFCETRLARVATFVVPGSNGKTCTELGVECPYPDEVFLYTNASQIIGDDKGWARADQIKANPDGSSSGLIWCKAGCDNGPPGKPAEVGSPTNPVVFVVDGEMQTNGTIFYGMLFMRDPNATVDESTGGIASFKQNGSKAAVFGSVFIQGEFENGSGNGPVVGDNEIMKALANNPRLAQFDTLRGGWTDRYSY